MGLKKKQEKEKAIKREITLLVQYKPEKGRGIFLGNKEKVPLGTLMFETLPFTAVLRYEHWNTSCFYCYTPCDQPLKRCYQCEQVLYCTETCQKKDWIYHREECTVLPEFIEQCHHVKASAHDMTDFLLLSRTLYGLKKTNRNAQYPEDLTEFVWKPRQQPIEATVDLVKKMCTAKRLLKNSTLLDVLLKTKLLSRYLSSKKELYAWLSAFQCNNFAITDERMVAIGAGVYPVASLINHSCHPNCLCIFDSQTHILKCRSIVDINPQEELLISYIDTVIPTLERKCVLNATYGFLCSCNLCENPVLLGPSKTLDSVMRADRWERPIPQLGCLPWETFTAADLSVDKICSSTAFQWLKSPNASKILHKDTLFRWLMCAVEQLENSQAQGLLEPCCEALDILSNTLHSFNLDLYSQRCNVFSLAVEQSSNFIGLLLGEKMVSFLELVYQKTQHHPILGLHYCVMKDLCSALQDCKGYQTYQKKAFECLQVAYGIDHPLVKVLTEGGFV